MKKPGTELDLAEWRNLTLCISMVIDVSILLLVLSITIVLALEYLHNDSSVAARLHLFAFLFKTYRKVAFKACCRTMQDNRGVNHKRSQITRRVEGTVTRPLTSDLFGYKFVKIAHHTSRSEPPVLGPNHQQIDPLRINGLRFSSTY